MSYRPGSISRGGLTAVLAALGSLAVLPADAAAAPETSIDSGPSGLTNDPSPTFTFSSPFEVLPVSFQCRHQRVGEAAGPWEDCSSPWTLGESGEYRIPPENGDYVFEVRAVDATGPDESPATRGFTIDTVAPQTEINGGPGDTTDITAVFLFSAPGAVGFSCRLDGGPWSPCGSPQTYSGLSLGAHRFEVTATDAAGNQDPSPAEHAWQVLRPGLKIPGAVKLATSLAKELVQIRRALAKMGVRALARRRTLVFKTFDALTAGTVEVRARARVRQGARRRWIAVLKGKREVPDAGRHRIRATVTKKGRRLARRRQRLPLELRLSFTDLVGRSLWATSKLTLKR